MHQPTIKQLQAFWWAASCASFVTAAQRLNLSVSSLSKRISELEHLLGHTVFDRSGHKAVLTPAGEQLLPAALNVLNAMAALTEGLQSGAQLSGSCRMGVGDLSALTWLPGMMAALRRAHPRLQLEAVVDVGGVLEQKLADGELDFAVLAGRSSRSSLLSEPVAAAHFAWCAQAGLPGADGHTPLASLLEQYPLITLPAGAGTTRLLDDWLLAHRINVRQRLLCNSWAAVAGMLCEGLGIGFLPAGWLASLPLQPLATEQPLAPLQYAMQWRRGDARILIHTLQSLARQQVRFEQPLRLLHP